MFYYGKDSWSRVPQINKDSDDFESASSERQRLLEDRSLEAKPYNGVQLPITRPQSRRSHPKWVIAVLRCCALTIITAALVVFAVGLYLRTRTYAALLGPVGCLLVVSVATEYYRLSEKGYLRRCEEAKQRLTESCSNCEWRGKSKVDTTEHDHWSVQ